MAFALAACGIANAHPVLGPPPLRDYVVDEWTTRNGLPHNSLRDIAQTPEGHLWFATWEGAVRYNGIDFTVVGRGTRPGLRDNGIGALYVDPAGRLWLSDSRGNLGRLQPDGQWRFWERAKDWPQALIHDMAMDSRGRLWLLFENHGMGRLDPDDRFTYLAPPAGIPLAASFPRMAIDAEDRVWVGTMDGLVIRQPNGRWERAPARWNLPPGLAWPYRAADGSLWLVASDRVYRLQGDTVALVKHVPGLGHFTAMLRDRNGELWLGTENHGLLRIGAHGVERLPGGDVLPNGRIASLLEDAEGNIWVGANGGLFRLRETLFSAITRRDGISGDYVRAIFEDRDGELWIGGGGGLDRLGADGQVRHIGIDRADSDRADALSVLSIAQGVDGDLWVGTYADGVFRLRDGRLQRRYAQDEGVPSGHVRAIAVDDAGVVWAGTRRGLVSLDGQGAHAPSVPGLPQGLITALASIDGALWIGSVEGAHVLRDGKVERIDLEASGARSVFGFRSVHGDVWIATDRGLYRYREGKLARVGLEQGLPVDAVFQIVPDRVGNAWVTSNRGVLRIATDALDTAADGSTTPVPNERYTEADGLPSAQANGSSSPSAILRRDGSVWIATAAGVASVDPARLQRYLDRRAPPTVIERVALDGRDVPFHSRAALPGGKRIGVSYVGLSYVMSDRIRYRTRLIGLDEHWVERDRQRTVEYMGLPPGDYVLQVAAAHPGGPWTQDVAVWAFTIKPLWWQRADTRVLAALLLIGALFALYRYLVHRYRTKNVRLARLVNERTRDLQAQAERLLAVDRERAQLLERVRRQAVAYERQAREDALTGLPNRRRFDEVLKRDMAVSQRAGHPLCLALIDLDHFKRINDTHSHAVGDAVLREAAILFASGSRAADLLARLGGEEFALLLPDTTLDEAITICERMQETFQKHAIWAGIEGLRVTFSVGIAECRFDDTTARLLERADAAMYRAKNQGRNIICVDANPPQARL
ncbi:ligand-binding sensor domain-containing diguanylate cyclase [Lysobacter auxotrophicus]|uniref:diguanylate cyclase n=1 Tax=Lysobacter auxotrophicus TaxID=2992573 RepID=A0ABM8DBV4_9GAMM|nr:ligand-binding sensor domain-containing diguanylate cyclase [Lysobacter auxotrophicus]BDU16003.1 diguanylate cyclase [Lysobacter auxotrophicus]